MIEEYPMVEPISKHEYYKDKIVYFYYQFTRTKDIESLRAEFDDFIQVLKNDRKNPEFEPYVFQIYKLTLHTRDQYNGKGEHDVSYMLIDVLYIHLKTIALACLYQFVHPCYNKQAFGSWRDIKYLCDYTDNEDLIDECVDITNTALAKDIVRIKKHQSQEIKNIRAELSNVSKWIPRENKKFSWLFDRLAIDWSKKYTKYLIPNRNHENYSAAIRKTKMQYRKLIATINKILDTVETKLCANEWSNINIENIPQLAFTKYKNSLCKYVFNEPQIIFEKTFYNDMNMQRLECSLKTKKYFENKYYPHGPYEPDRPRSDYIPFSLPLSKIIKQAFDSIDNSNELRVDVLNNEWTKLSETIGKAQIRNAIPIIDMSFLSNQTDSYYTAIGLALLVAERSTFAKRILVIDNKMSWINIDNENTLTAMIKKIREETRSRIHSCIDIENTMREFVAHIDDSRLPNMMIKELSLVYFQTQATDDSLHEKIIRVFYEGGLVGSRKLPFPCPRMVYWNLSQKKTSMPGKINSKNSVFLSGHSANLIKDLQLLRTDKYDTINEIIKEYMHPSNMD
jgi:Domain of unknown function (DUF2828)